MASQVRSLFPLILGASMLGSGTTLLAFAMAARAQNFGGEGLAGLAFALFYAGFLVGVLYARRTIARVGQIRAFAAHATIVSVVAIAPNLIESAYVDLFLRFALGVSFAIAFTAVDSWLNDGADENSRGLILGVYYSCIVLGHIFGNLIASPASPFVEVGSDGALVVSQQIFVLATLLISLSLVPIALSQGRGPMTQEAEPLSLGELFNTSPAGAFGAFAAGVIVSNTQGLMPSIGEFLGISNDIVYVMIAVLVGGFVVQYPIGWLTKRVDRRSLIIIVCLIGAGVALAISLFVTPDQQLSQMAIFGLFAALGGMTYLIYPLAVAQVYDYLDHSKYVSATVGLLIIYSAGAIIGTFGTGLAMTWNPSALFWVITGMYAVFALFVAYRTQARSAPIIEDQGDFIPLPLTSPELAEMDPRTEPALEEPEEEAA